MGAGVLNKIKGRWIKMKLKYWLTLGLSFLLLMIPILLVIAGDKVSGGTTGAQ